MSEETRPQPQVEDDPVLVHHLIRRLGRRPTPSEVQEYQEQHPTAAAVPTAQPVPPPRTPGPARP